jgi:hypothetical protein
MPSVVLELGMRKKREKMWTDVYSGSDLTDRGVDECGEWRVEMEGEELLFFLSIFSSGIDTLYLKTAFSMT